VLNQLETMDKCYTSTWTT